MLGLSAIEPLIAIHPTRVALVSKRLEPIIPTEIKRQILFSDPSFSLFSTINKNVMDIRMLLSLSLN